MLESALKEYVVLRVDGWEGIHRELAAESAIEGEALRVARMLSESAVASSSLRERGVSYEVRLSATGGLLESFPVRGREYSEGADEGRLLEFPMRFAVA